MYCTDLLRRSRSRWELQPVYVSRASPATVFRSGAGWMAARMNVDEAALAGIPFARFGMLKYALAVAGCGISGVLFFRMHPALAIVAIPVFYIIEMHFLFLFPLLIDRASSPWLQSLRWPYRIGFFHTLTTLMCIAAFMLSGLLRLRHPLRNWHIGCLAVIIWYADVSGSRQ